MKEKIKSIFKYEKNPKKDKKILLGLAIFIVSVALYVVCGTIYIVNKTSIIEVTSHQEITNLEREYNFNLIQGAKLEVFNEVYMYPNGVIISGLRNLDDVKTVFSSCPTKLREELYQKIEKFDKEKTLQNTAYRKKRTGIVLGASFGKLYLDKDGTYIVELFKAEG